MQYLTNPHEILSLNLDLERLSNFPRVTQLGGIGTPTQV